MYKIAKLPGDGIGPEIVAEAEKVLNAIAQKFNHKFEFLGELRSYGKKLTKVYQNCKALIYPQEESRPREAFPPSLKH